MSPLRLLFIAVGGLLLAAAGVYVWRASNLSSAALSTSPGEGAGASVQQSQSANRSENATNTAQTPSPRIVALSPAIGIILRDLGRVSSVVGRHGYDSFLPSQIPTCGDQAGIDFERLLTVSPSHILTQWGTRELPERLRTLSTQKGWITADYPLLSLTDIRDAVIDIDRLSSHQELGKTHTLTAQAAKLVEEMDQAWSAREGIFKGRVLLLASVKPYGIFGPGSCHHDILLALGATPAVTQGARYINLDAEKLIEIAPDVIIYLDPLVVEGQPRVEPLTLSIGNRPFQGRALALRDAESQIPSTSMIRVANLIAQALVEVQTQPQ